MPDDNNQTNNPYDPTPAEGDQYEPVKARHQLRRDDYTITLAPLDEGDGDGDGANGGNGDTGGGVVLHPGDTYSEPLGPEQIQHWYASAPDGTSVIQFVERVPNTGGHFHGGADNSMLAAGSITPTQFIISGPWPQNVPQIYLSPVSCGTIYHEFNFLGQPPIRIFYDVQIPGLVPIGASASLKLKQPTNDHPASYWATPAFAAQLHALADAYLAATGDALTCTDASLPWGGRFDLNDNWGPPHREHFYGNTADIRSSDVRDRQAFDTAATAAGVTYILETAPPHYHVRG